jgi:transcriptional regulator with XRE-family HTH domain
MICRGEGFEGGQDMAHPVDVHVGARIRQRRFLLGMTQQALAARLGITFQQLQKYEMGTNRVSASRLWDIARLLDVPVEFFFDDFGTAASDGGRNPANGAQARAAGTTASAAHGRRAAALAAATLPEVASERDAATLLRAFCAIPPQQRRRLLDLARSLTESGG